MSLRQLKVDGFRNLQPVRLRVAEGVQVVALTGPNGAGKTSVLEAVSLLGGGRGLLGAEARAQLNATSSPVTKSWTVWGESATDVPLAVSFSTVGGVQRRALVGGRAATGEQLAAALPVCWLAPRLDRLFYEGPGDRRDWLDEQAAALMPGHAGLVTRYTQHKRGRMKILREGRHLRAGGADWIDAEERLMAEAGMALLRSRRGYLNQLNGVADGVRLELAGSALSVLDEADPVAALQGKFARSREIDTRMERTHAGPDTLDVGGVFQAEQGTAEVALNRVSSGQHKRTLVRLVLAQARLLSAVARQGVDRMGERPAPVVLIDELGAHLDMANRAGVLQELVALGCQVWVTDTDFFGVAGSDVQVLAVRDGVVQGGVA